MKKIFFFTTIICLLGSHIAFAAGGEKFDIIDRVGASLTSISEDIQEGSDELAEELQTESEEKAKTWGRDMTVKGKDLITNAFGKWINNRIEDVKNAAKWLLSSPKKWVQQGSDYIREWLGVE